MSDINTLFINLLKRKIPQNISTTEEIAGTLGISYDAAYRRLNGKVFFNIEEVILLSKKFDISLNSLYEVGETSSYLIRETKPINNLNDIGEYFSRVYAEIKQLSNRNDSSLLFAAREIPMFYFFNNPSLVKFKVFIWFSLLKITQLNKRIAYHDFIVPKNMISTAQKIGKIYEKINVTEVWSFGAINNVLQQILYLYNMRQLSQNEATEICMALIDELKKVEEITMNNSIKKIRKLELYSNDLIMMNNSIIFNLKGRRLFAYPYALLKFFIIENQKACLDQEAYINEQIQLSTCISNTSTTEHAAFFNHKYDKINQVLRVIDNKEKEPIFL